MPIRSWEIVEEIKRTGNILISVKALSKNIYCNPEICQGACCKNHYGNMVAHYHPKETWKLSPELKDFALEEDNSTVKTKKGDCLLIPHCLESPEIIPTECRLFPLTFNKNNRLVLSRSAILPDKVNRCAICKGDKPLYLSLKQCFTDIFGIEIYNKIAAETEAYIKESKI
jgi:hypothetical protein